MDDSIAEEIEVQILSIRQSPPAVPSFSPAPRLPVPPSTPPPIAPREGSILEECLSSLLHSCRCSGCPSQVCMRIRKVIRHARECRRRDSCLMCRNLIRLSLDHARRCERDRCPVPFCFALKRDLRKREDTNGMFV